MRNLLLLVICFLYSASASAEQSLHDKFRLEMDYLTKRDRILSENIANVDTPMYKPKDLIKNKNTFYHTHNHHLYLQYELVPSTDMDLKPNGNAVNLEAEMQKKSENAMMLSEVTAVYNKLRTLNRMVIGEHR